MTDAVWEVNVLLGIGLIGVIYVLYYILTLDRNEEVTDRNSHTDKINN